MSAILHSCTPDLAFSGAEQVDVRLGPASETLDRLAAEGKRFDLAFLDADKTGYLGYYKKVGLCWRPVVSIRQMSCCLLLQLLSHESACTGPT